MVQRQVQVIEQVRVPVVLEQAKVVERVLIQQAPEQLVEKSRSVQRSRSRLFQRSRSDY